MMKINPKLKYNKYTQSSKNLRANNPFNDYKKKRPNINIETFINYQDLPLHRLRPKLIKIPLKANNTQNIPSYLTPRNKSRAHTPKMDLGRIDFYPNLNPKNKNYNIINTKDYNYKTLNNDEENNKMNNMTLTQNWHMLYKNTTTPRVNTDYINNMNIKHQYATHENKNMRDNLNTKK